MSLRHVETLFCDDIRQEVSGKVSFIGAYSTNLFVPKFPTILPKLCLAVKVIVPVAEPIAAMSLKVYRDNEVLQEVTVDEQQLRAASDSADDDSGPSFPSRAQVIQFMLVFSPINFDSSCSLRVRVQIDGEELRGLGLTVGKLPEA